MARQVQKEAWARFVVEYPPVCIQATVKHGHAAIPDNVQLVGTYNVSTLSKIDPIAAGWGCQGHSKTGLGKVVQDLRPTFFFDLVIIIAMSQETNNKDVCYLLKSVYSNDNARVNVVEDFDTIRYVLVQEAVTTQQGTIHVLTEFAHSGPIWSMQINRRK